LETVEIGDITDDRCADILCALSDDTSWSVFAQELMESLVQVYDLQKKCVRIDTTSVKRYTAVNEQGLLQYGQSKDHRLDLARLNVAPASRGAQGFPDVGIEPNILMDRFATLLETIFLLLLSSLAPLVQQLVMQIKRDRSVLLQ
jgi:hypothetical protein